MTELSGMLAGVGLPAMVRFLTGVKKTGRLRLAQDEWSGDVFFSAGAVTHATLESRTGLGALDGMLELFPEASFSFDSSASDATAQERTIQLNNAELLAYLDSAADRAAHASRRLPRADAVPSQVASEGVGDDPLPLDRGTLQTLLAVDGQRSVREIVAMRRSVETLWHLASLGEVGLITFDTASNGVNGTVDKHGVETVMPSPSPMANGSAKGVVHCPKLGFEDDPMSSFSRPTRVHRCFATATTMSPSLDQQRDLCLTDQFGTCSRLQAAPVSATPFRGARPGARRLESTNGSEPRVVRAPFGGRGAAAAGREEPRPATSEPTPLRPASTAAREEAAVRPAPVGQSSVVRARLERPPSAQSATAATAAATAASTMPTPTVQVPREPPAPPPAPHEQARAAAPSDGMFRDERRRIGQIPVVTIAAVGVGVLLLAALAYLLAPQLSGDSSLDANTLPNAHLVEEGTPVAALAAARATPVAGVASANAAGAAAQATPAVSAQPTDAAVSPGSQAGQAAAAGQPSAVPGQAGPTAGAPGQPSAVPVQAGASTGVGQASTTDQTSAAPAIFDERFTTNAANWPSNPQGLGQFTNGSYRIATHDAGQSAAIGAPVASVPADVQITADFRKLGGPDGGGYGIIVRDQQAGVRDGSSQDGRYYVLEAGDKGEVGIWRRDGDHWVDLVPWQHADAVRTGTEPNELSVRAVGNTLTLLVNGTQVATATDSTLASGQAGVFVGGDGNQVAVSRYTVQTP
ncbi:MAG: DUF4388 domain-containing protein [Chloroflexi bacterium]|nr:DUF4388 domain-containing protein [Chloroflexota bacterium]